MTVYRIDLAYDGGGFHGYATQPDVRTVQDDLEAALARVLRVEAVKTTVAGRTDAGVHAAGQVVSFSFEGEVDVQGVARSLNSQLNPEIAVRAVVRADDGFDARFAATSRTYVYRIDNAPVPDPLLRTTHWHVADPLDVAAMNEAVQHLIGTLDFASLCRTAAGRSTERTVLSTAWERAGLRVVLTITASSFCHQMVRSIVAMSVDVGRRRLSADEIPAILAARDRNATRGAAPPHGLVLERVGYQPLASSE